MKKYFFVLSIIMALLACNKTDLQSDISEKMLEFTVDVTEVTPASFLVFTSNTLIKKDTASVQIGEVSTILVKLDSFRMGMWVPVIPSGNYNINLKNAGGQDSFAIRILPSSPIADPVGFLMEMQNDAKIITDSLARYQTQSMLSADELKFISELISRIDSKLSRLTPSQKQELAYLSQKFISARAALSIPMLDTSLVVSRLSQINNPAGQFSQIVNSLLSIHQNINILSSLNLIAGKFWNTSPSDLNEAAYLTSLQFYLIEKSRALLLNKQISTFACVAEGELSIKEGPSTGSGPVSVIRGRFINQRVQGTFRTINQSDEKLLNGKVFQLYNLNNGLVNSDVMIQRQWNQLHSSNKDLMNSVPTPFTFYVSPLPVSSRYKTAEIPASALVITRVSEPGISVVASENSDGSLRLFFNSTSNAIPDGTIFSVRINYNQESFNRSVSLAQELSFENYPNITIGGKRWMQENTAVKFFKNGDPIPYVSWGPTWATLKTPAWCYYNNDPSSETTYGLLYNWYAVNDARGFAPEGWHVATDTEWKDMIAFLGGNAVAGGKIKAVSPLWNAPNTGATNSSGFTAFPAGTRGNGGTYVNLGISSAWWTANQYGPNGSWSYYAGHNTSSVTRGGASKQDGYSVRCVKD